MQGAIAHVDSGALGNITHAHYRNAHYAAYGRWFAARGRSRPASNGAMVSNVYAMAKTSIPMTTPTPAESRSISRSLAMEYLLCQVVRNKVVFYPDVGFQIDPSILLSRSRSSNNARLSRAERVIRSISTLSGVSVEAW